MRRPGPLERAVMRFRDWIAAGRLTGHVPGDADARARVEQAQRELERATAEEHRRAAENAARGRAALAVLRQLERQGRRAG